MERLIDLILTAILLLGQVPSFGGAELDPEDLPFPLKD